MASSHPRRECDVRGPIGHGVRNRRAPHPGIEPVEPRILMAEGLLAALRAHGLAATPTPGGSDSLRAVRAGVDRTATAIAIPGQIGQVISATFTLTARRATYRNEVGLF